MKKYAYRLFQLLIKTIHGNKIAGKKIKGTNALFLHYEISQHLTFYGKPEIEYEPHLKEKIRPYVEGANLVFDIGTNIGQYALIFSSWLRKDDSKVIGFEPDGKNFAFAQFNVHYNRLKNVELFNQGVGSRSGKLVFYRDTVTGGRRGSFIQAFTGKAYEGNKEEVEIVTFDQLIHLHGIPNFVKIDVEGFEFEVLKGLTAPSDETVFFIEVRDETKNSVFSYFQNVNFKCYLLDNQSAPRFITSSDEIPGFANLLFLKE